MAAQYYSCAYNNLQCSDLHPVEYHNGRDECSSKPMNLEALATEITNFRKGFESGSKDQNERFCPITCAYLCIPLRLLWQFTAHRPDAL